MKKLTKEQFIEKAKAVHLDKYNYSKVNYINNRTKVIIICPEHGEFEQRASAHTKGRGCDKCARENNKLASSITQLKNQDVYIRELKTIHGNTLIFDKTVYLGSFKKVICTCSVHGDFEINGSDLLTRGCPSCGIQKSKDNQHTKTNEEFVKDAKLIHGNKYDYSKVNYINAQTKVNIICKLHGEFEQAPKHHLQGANCPSCSTYGFNPNKPAYLYYLKVTTNDGQILYKIGITNRTVNERFNLTDLAKIEIVKQKLYENGQDALDWETKLKRQFKEYQYKGPNILSSGNTELFTEDIINLFP